MTDNHTVFVICGEVSGEELIQLPSSKSHIYLIQAVYFCLEYVGTDAAGQIQHICSLRLIVSYWMTYNP